MWEEREWGWYWLQPTPVVPLLLPCSFLCLPLSSAGSSIRSPAPCSPGGSCRAGGPLAPEVWRGNPCVVFTAGPQGGREPGPSAEQGLWKEKGRGPGCLNSWAGSAAAIPAHLSPPLLPGSAPCPFLPGGLPVEPLLLDFCGWRAFSALRLLREVFCVFPRVGLWVEGAGTPVELCHGVHGGLSWRPSPHQTQ